MKRRYLALVLMTALVAGFGWIAGAAPARHAIPLASNAEVRNITVHDGDVFVAFLEDRAVSIQRLRPDGRSVWRRDLPAKAYMRVRSGRVLIAELLPRGGTHHLEILRAADGSPVTQMEASQASADLSISGDAVVFFQDPFKEASPFVVLKHIETGATRAVRVGQGVGSAVALDFNRVIIQRLDGVVDRYDGDNHTWSTKVGFSDLAPIEISPNGSFVLVKEDLGKFTVVEVATGWVKFRHDPQMPNPLSALDLERVAAEGLKNGTLRRSGGEPTDVVFIAANLQPAFVSDTVLNVQSAYETLPSVKIDLRNARVTRGRSKEDVRRTFETEKGMGSVRAARHLELTEQEDIRILVVPGQLILEK